MWIDDVEFLRTIWRHLDREELLRNVPGLTEERLAFFFKRLADLLEREKNREAAAGEVFVQGANAGEESSSAKPSEAPEKSVESAKAESRKKTPSDAAEKGSATKTPASDAGGKKKTETADGPRLIINSDGGFGKKETASIGVVIRDAESGKVLEEISERVPCETNNESEYEAIIRAAQWALDHDARDVTFRVDSQLLARQLTGQYRVKAPNLKPYYQRAKSLLDRLPSVRIEWVPRSRNEQADALANDAKSAL